MARPIKLPLSCRSLLCISLQMAVWCIRKARHLGNWIYAHHYSIGSAATLLFLFLNVLVYRQSCTDMKRYLDPVKLRHGFAPVFPFHFFHGPDINNTSILNVAPSLNEPDKLDLYLHNYVLHGSLSLDIPPVIHIVWCDQGPFTFAHYLSVLAAFKAIKPSVLYLHLLKEPELDPNGYFQFLPDLERDIPPLVKRMMTTRDVCTGSNKVKLFQFMKLLGTTGGFVINGRTMIVPSPSFASVSKSKISLVTFSDVTSEALILVAQTNALNKFLSNGMSDDIYNTHVARHLNCQNVREFTFLPEELCVYIHEDIYPEMIFNSSAHADALSRWIAYGTSKRLISQAADSIIVPNIVHYVWLGKREFDFFSYLSLLSSLHVLKADYVYIHGNHKPLGDIWKEVENNPQVKFIHRDFPSSVYGEPVVKFPSHASDYLRADVLLRYGGVYADWDVIFLKEMPHKMRQHNTTTNVDWPETGAFPDVFNLGVLVAAPGAPFLRYFIESYRWYLDKHWSYNAIHMPYKVYEKQPCSLNIDRHLQVLCAHDRCHATWLKDYKEESVDHLNPLQFNWRTEAMAIHWTHPDPAEFKSKTDLFAAKSVPGQIGQFVMISANMSP